MRVTLDTNLDDILSDLRDFDSDAEEMITLAGRMSAQVVYDHIVANWPVASGASRAGWDITEVSPTHIVVENSTDYAMYVHSHPNQDGPPPLAERLYDEIAPTAEQEFVDHITSAFEEALEG